MKVLVIGGTGVISTPLVHQLVEEGHRVSVVNRGVTEDRLPAEVERLRADRWKPGELEKALKGRFFDAVIDMMAFEEEHAEQLIRLFWGKTSQVLLCSTVCTLGGELTKVPAAEEEPCRPVTRYGRKKAAIEKHLLSRNGERKTFVTVLRPSHTIGEGAPIEGVLFDLSMVDRLRKGKAVILHDGGKTKWATAYAGDVARGFVRALGNPKTFGEIYHLASPDYTTWRGVYEALAAAVEGVLNIVSIPWEWLAHVAPRRSVAVRWIYRFDSWFDVKKAERDLGFSPKTSLEEAFRRQLHWMEERGKILPAEKEPLQDILWNAYRENRSVSPELFSDFNPWGNETTL